MIRPLQLHTNFAFEVRRHQDGPPVSLSLSVITNGVDDEGNERTINETLTIHKELMRELQEGKLGETVEKRGVAILTAKAEGPQVDPSELVTPPTTSIYRPPDDSPF